MPVPPYCRPAGLVHILYIMGALRAWAGLAAILALTGSLLWPAGTAADQTDPRLDRLFAVLQTSEDTRELQAAQDAIWQAWAHHENADIDRLMQRGIFALNNRDFPEASAIFDTLVAVAPDFAEAWNKRATMYFLIGNLEQSAADVEKTLALEPRHFGALSGLGQIELLRGRPEAARAAFEAALQIHPHLDFAREMLRRLRRSLDGEQL